ncbi:GNAT family N-acetyltransferase [Streptomyces profundus]|uniref:GNAT family N-acetyltransferase n=1 Tax=Streptomyces profundus TaxID=2867410 RepID=UPI001D16A24D|nr:GNAT family N-acetyltransferase [Streptomyces sp. MA3_2.13]UED84834.1 GNAT family N-acetyltransferase [Streptomyces sp. MA3_2.13]
MVDLEIRGVDGDRDASVAWLRGVVTGFFKPTSVLSDEELEYRLAHQPLGGARGVFDGDRCVATFDSWPQRLTTVGGAELAAHAVSAVTVTATHRRRGLLSRLMEPDLRAAKEGGASVATLIAAEHRIYGRFGFGPATSFTNWKVDVHRSGFDRRWSPADLDGSVRLADGAEVREAAPALHERFRTRTAGGIDRNALFWERMTGLAPTSPPVPPATYAIYRDAAGVPRGVVGYVVDDEWTHGQPNGTARTTFFYAEDDEAELALWRLLLSLDWAGRLETGRARPDSVLPLVLPDPRAAVASQTADFLWLRPLDVPAMLAARSYATEGEVVFEVRDALGLANGRFLLSAGKEGAECAPTARNADVTLDVGAFAQLYLGDQSAARLRSAGLLAEETDGAAARVDLLFHTGRRPWCPDMF